jgi:hypothetical protein
LRTSALRTTAGGSSWPGPTTASSMPSRLPSSRRRGASSPLIFSPGPRISPTANTRRLWRTSSTSMGRSRWLTSGQVPATGRPSPRRTGGRFWSSGWDRGAAKASGARRLPAIRDSARPTSRAANTPTVAAFTLSISPTRSTPPAAGESSPRPPRRLTWAIPGAAWSSAGSGSVRTRGGSALWAAGTTPPRAPGLRTAMLVERGSSSSIS